MSFVSIVARENLVSIASDGRVCRNDGLPIQEDYKKFIEINEKSFIAFAGNKEPCELFIRNSGLLSQHARDFKALAVQIQNQLMVSPLSKFKILLSCGGLDCCGEIVFFTFSTLQTKIQFFRPKGDEICYAFLNNSSLNDAQVVERLVECFRISGIETADQIKQAQVKLNNIIATMDQSVNTTVFTFVINRLTK